MTVSELKAILPQLQSLRFHTVSDEGLIVYTRSYAALYNMVSVNALDDEFGAREIYRKKLDSLFASLSRRYGNLQGIGLRAEAVDAMLHILNGTGCIVGRQKRDLCFGLFDELTKSYLFDFDETACDHNALYGVMRLIYQFLCWLVPEDAENDPWLGFARNRVAAWATELHENGEWKGIRAEEALQRIILMSMNSYMLLDSRHDAIIQKAYSYYCISRQLQFCRTTELTADEIRYYILIYDAIQQSSVNDPGSRKYLNDLAGLLEVQRMPKSSVEALFCRSIAIDNLCDQISNEAQRRMWANVK